MEDHDLGLAHDLPLLINRRRALGVLAGGVGLAVAACGSSDSAGSGQATTAAPSTATTSTAAAEIPEETAGPFPATARTGRTPSPRAALCAATSRRASATRPARPRGFRPRST